MDSGLDPAIHILSHSVTTPVIPASNKRARKHELNAHMPSTSGKVESNAVILVLGLQVTRSLLAGSLDFRHWAESLRYKTFDEFPKYLQSKPLNPNFFDTFNQAGI